MFSNGAGLAIEITKSSFLPVKDDLALSCGLFSSFTKSLCEMTGSECSIFECEVNGEGHYATIIESFIVDFTLRQFHPQSDWPFIWPETSDLCVQIYKNRRTLDSAELKDLIKDFMTTDPRGSGFSELLVEIKRLLNNDSPSLIFSSEKDRNPQLPKS